MKSIYSLIPALVIVILMIGPASAQVTIGTGGTGSVYTTGSIYVASTPAGASAVLDGGASQLFTPGTFSSVTPGIHNVMITKPGFQPSSTNVQVSIGETQNVIVTLPPVTSPGGISVSSTPKGAGLYVDDIYQGKTNQVVGNLAAGPHSVVISEAGYELWSDTVIVVSGQVTPVTATLVAEVNPSTGDLRVSSVPSGAAVYVNGDYKGFTPLDDLLDVNDLAPGTYAVLVRKSGYQDYETNVTIQAGKNVQILAYLQPASQAPDTASAEIVSNPSGADVYVNNLYMGTTPLSFQDVPEGTYTVDIKLEGYNTFSTTGQVIAGQSIHVIAALSPIATPTPTTRAPVGTLLSVMALVIAGITVVMVQKR